MSFKLSDVRDDRLRQRLQQALEGDTRTGENLIVAASGSATQDRVILHSVSTSESKRLRQNHKPLLNKLETEYLNRIKDQHPNYPPVRAQAKTFKLCNGVRFTPDLSCSIWPVAGSAARETCWEIKGPKAWDDALVKIKMAAHEWPEICWRFVWKESGVWKEQIVLP